MEDRTQVGVFLGYVLDPGGKWSGQYYVAALEAFAGRPLHKRTPPSKCKVHIQRVREILPVTKADIFFPLRGTYERCNYTLEGIEAHLGKSRDAVNHDLPPDVVPDPAQLFQAPQEDENDGPNNDHHEDDTTPVMMVVDLQPTEQDTPKPKTQQR